MASRIAQSVAMEANHYEFYYTVLGIAVAVVSLMDSSLGGTVHK